MASSCSTARKSGGLTTSPMAENSQGNFSFPQSTEPMGPPEPFGPPLPGAGQQAVPAAVEPSYGPQPVQIRPVVLVLGPGLARGYAYIGVLQALKDSKIPIGAIFGTEIGSLIGALYANSSSINQFEWGLLKFKEEVFQKKSGFLSTVTDQPSDGAQFEKQLKQVFGKKDLSGLKTPMGIIIQLKDKNTPVIVNHGSIASAIRAAMADHRLFTESNWPDDVQGVPALSAAQTKPFAVSEAKALGFGPVVVVDVLNESEEGIALDELKNADFILRPDVAGIGEFDFQKKTDAAFRGKKAVQKQLAELKRLVGLPEDNNDARRSANP